MTKQRPLPKVLTRLVVGLATVTLALVAAAPMASAAPFAYIGYQGASEGMVAVVDASNYTVIASVPVGATPSGVAVNAAGTKAWVASSGVGATTVSLIEVTLSAGQPTSVGIAASVQLSRDRMMAIALDASGSKAYVTHGDGFISVIDTTSYQVSAFPAAAGNMLKGIAVNPAGTRLFVGDASQSAVLVIDPALQTLVGSPLKVGFVPEGLAVNPAGTQAYAVGSAPNTAGTLSIIDVNTLAWTNLSLGSGVMPTGVAVHPAGHHVYVTNRASASVAVVYAPTKTVLSPTLRVPRNPQGIAIDPTGERVFVLSDAATGMLSVIDPQSLKSWELPGIPLSFGAFVGGGAAGNAKLQEELDAANATVARLMTELAKAEALMSELAAANAKVASLTSELTAANAEVSRLRAQVDDLNKQLASVADLKAELAKANELAKHLSDELEAAHMTIASFVRRLMTGRTDANVAAAARDAAERQIQLAITKLGASSPRVRHAQREFRDGLNAFAAGHFQRALKQFVDAYESAARLRKSS